MAIMELDLALTTGSLLLGALAPFLAMTTEGSPESEGGSRGSDDHDLVKRVLEGDGTALYLSEQLEALGVRLTRLARGIPTGTRLAGASKAVLSDAIQSRQRMGDE